MDKGGLGISVRISVLAPSLFAVHPRTADYDKTIPNAVESKVFFKPLQLHGIESRL